MKMVKVEDSVHSKLQSVGAYGETMSDIISKCVDFYMEKRKK